MAQNIFERCEKKYIISKQVQETLLERISDRAEPDQYGSYAISNLYYDTENYDLIRNSMEKPFYKEKLRMRSYGKAEEDSQVFVELKKKFKGIVYKRRIALSYGDAKIFLKKGLTGIHIPQIGKEIQYFIQANPVQEKVFLSYDRKALKGICDNELRITFDTNIKFRQNNLLLSGSDFGQNIISQEEAIMEIKFLGAMPIWLSKELSNLSVFPSSFSKYGTCYKNFILKNGTVEEEVKQSA